MNEQNNWECKECGHVCARKLGVVTHLRRHHNITKTEKIEKMIIMTSKEITRPNQIHANQISRQKINYKCRKCEHICKSEAGIRAHIIMKHQISSGKENFEETPDAITNPSRKGKRKMKPKKKNKNMCPGGGTFSIDTDELPECENCFIWDECDSSNSNDDENSEADKILKRHSESNKEKEEREFPKFPIEIRIDSDGMRIITPVPIEITQIVISKKGIVNAN